MKKLFTCLLFLLIFFKIGEGQNPTWADNVACIFYTHCTNCHNEKGIAPFPLISYDDASDNAQSILSSVTSGEMPPWPSDEAYQKHAHPRKLNAKEIDVITKWVNAGAPQGDPSHAPKPPVYNNTNVITNPELVAKIPLYTVNTATDLYRCFVIPSGLTVEKFITAFEVIPGDRNIVHHVLVYQDTSVIPLILDALDPEPGYTNFGGTGSSAATLIGAWVPGSQPYFLPSGMGIPISAKANIVLQIHYPAGTTAKIDSTYINLRLATSNNLRPVTIAPALNHLNGLTDGPLFIPANEVKTFHAKYVTTDDYTILGVAPHMHLIGTSIKAYGIAPGGDTIKFIDIPHWDFHWQGEYQFRKPIKIPSGTTLWAEAIYDNTTNNPENPNNPPKNVSVGENTTDEMMLVYFSYLKYKSGDENIPIDTSTVTKYYNNCNVITSTIDELQAVDKYDLYLYPNPAGNFVTTRWDLDVPQSVKIDLFNIAGGKIKTIINNKLNTGKHEVLIDINNLLPGIYFIQFQTANKVITKKLTKL